MPRLRTTGALTAVAASALLAAAGPTEARVVAEAAAKPTITISGSTSVSPLAEKLIKGYLKRNKGKVRFTLAQGGSDIGVADAAAGRVSIGMSARDVKPSDPGGVVFNKVARDAICLATSKQNALSNLSQAQVRAIFSGKIRNWSDVPGASASGPINLVVRTAASGTQDAFQLLFMGSDQVATSASAKASNGLVANAIKSDPNAIGYLSYAFTDGLNDVDYEGVACTLRTAKAGQYSGSRNFWFVTRGAASGATKKFIKWVQSRKGQKIVASEWVPIK